MSASGTPSDAPVSGMAIYSRLLRYARPYWIFAVVATIGMAFDAAGAAVFARLIQPMLDELFTARDPVAIAWMPVALVTLFIVRGAATFATDYGMARVGRSVVRDLRNAIFSRYQQLPATYFDREPSGPVISRVIYSAEQVAQASSEAIKVMIVDSLTVLGLLFVMLRLSASLTLYLFVMIPLTALVWQFVGRRYRRINRSIQGSMGSVTSLVEEAVQGHREVRIYGGQQREAARFAEAAHSNLLLNLKVAATNAFSTSAIQLVAAAALAAIVWRATRPDLLDTMSSGAFMSLITAMLLMLPSLKRLTSVQATVQRGVSAAEELFGVLDRPGEVDTGTRTLDRCRGDIAFRDVKLAYTDASAFALDSITLHCPPGSVTALVGPSGSGKSSLVSLLPRFYEPTGGELLLDGAPIAEYKLADLRAQIALVSQRVVIFNGSIADNIAYGGLADASEAQVIAAAEAANAMEFIQKLPDGIHSAVGEHGALLSGGQRQRIAIARALLKNAPILILDEATSALDTQSERLIQDALARLMHDRTTLVIAHRLSTVEHADQIAVLDGGRLIELGTHADLLARGGMYSALYRLQFRDDADTVPALPV